MRGENILQMSSINVPIFTISILIYMMGEFLYKKHKINEGKLFKIIIIALLLDGISVIIGML